MPTIPASDRTPQALLSENRLHGILGYQLAQAAIVTDMVFEETVARAHGLRRIEFTVLALVQGNPGVTARQLARALAVTPPNIAVCLDRLGAQGLLTRERGSADARMQHLTLTRKGSALIDRAAQAVLDGEAAALAGLSPGERVMLLELLHKTAQARRRVEGLR